MILSNLALKANGNITERRGKPRIDCDYPARVRISTLNSKKLESVGRISNLSASGLLVCLDKPVEPGQRLFVIINFSKESHDKDGTFSIAIQGHVTRIELQSGGRFGVAVKLGRYRFL